MRTKTQYSTVFKESIITKALDPNNKSVLELSKEFDIPPSTIHTWVNMKKKKQSVTATPLRPKDRSAEFKLKAIIDTMNVTEEERGAYCREHGIYTYNLDEWKKIIMAGLGNSGSTTKEQKAENQKTAIEMKKIKKELQRKEKALAEVSALLILKKKADLIWGKEKDD